MEFQAPCERLFFAAENPQETCRTLQEKLLEDTSISFCEHYKLQEREK